jgi:hypothetical protein
MGNKSPYKLIVTFEDPDSGNVMIFEKYEAPIRTNKKR